MTNNQNQFLRTSNLTFCSGKRKNLLSIKKILNNLGEGNWGPGGGVLNIFTIFTGYPFLLDFKGRGRT